MDTARIADRDRTILAWIDARPEQFQPRIWDRLIEQPNGCWDWSLSVNTGGYGHVWVPRTMVLVHRVVYLRTHGSIADGMQIDHTCRNRKCANPEHLRELTPRDNTRASSHYMRERCPAGHALTDDNLSQAHLRIGRRTCRTCQRDRERARRIPQ